MCYQKNQAVVFDCQFRQIPDKLSLLLISVTATLFIDIHCCHKVIDQDHPDTILLDGTLNTFEQIFLFIIFNDPVIINECLFLIP